MIISCPNHINRIPTSISFTRRVINTYTSLLLATRLGIGMFRFKRSGSSTRPHETTGNEARRLKRSGRGT
jgi:hypothetical protein